MKWHAEYAVPLFTDYASFIYQRLEGMPVNVDTSASGADDIGDKQLISPFCDEAAYDILNKAAERVAIEAQWPYMKSSAIVKSYI